jgi:hypothetical protein
MQVELEQRIIIKFLTKENMDADEILTKLHAHFEAKCVHCELFDYGWKR